MPSKQNRAVVINADDFGISDGVCQSIIQLFGDQAISNTSIMACAPDALKRTKIYLRELPEKRLGVHLQLTSGSPLSPRSEVPSLVDGNTGKFLSKEFAQNARPEEVYLEWNRQIEEVFETLGYMPIHLDSHHGMHRVERYQDVFVELAYKYGLCCRGGSPQINQKLKKKGVIHSEFLVKDWTGKRNSITFLEEGIKEAIEYTSKESLIEVVSHPGFNDEYLKATSSLNQGRESDILALKKLRRSKWLKKHDFKLISFAEYTEAMITKHD